MMSRQAIRAAVQWQPRWGRPLPLTRSWSSSVPALQRDLVNFPDPAPPQEVAKVRLRFLPEEWFQAFHDKTGATGGYMFLASVGTFMCSKEYLVLEHEFYTGLVVFFVVGNLIKAVGPAITEVIHQDVDKNEARLKGARLAEIQKCQDAIKNEEKSQWMATSYEQLITAKKENVALQLEAAYRTRLNDAYNQVRRRLDYQLEVSNVLRRVEQQHMVDWIIANVKKNITAKQEDDALKKCVADLKALAK